jgi:hypothetical protein
MLSTNFKQPHPIHRFCDVIDFIVVVGQKASRMRVQTDEIILIFEKVFVLGILDKLLINIAVHKKATTIVVLVQVINLTNARGVQIFFTIIWYIYTRLRYGVSK